MLIRLTLVGVALLLACAPVRSQQLENSKTPATSGTVKDGSEGRTSGANLSAGDKGPASETQMTPPKRVTGGRENGNAQAGANDTTKELFQH